MTAGSSDNGAIAPRLVGRYVVFDEIASGGMAAVHLGRLHGSVGFARTVAMKRLHPHLAKDPEFVSMFTDEARIAARIRHPNVAATLDVVSASGELFLVMEYIHGESLAKLIKNCAKRKTTVPVPIAVAVAMGTLLGLHAAHEATSETGERLDVVHRDVSPQNVMVGVDGVARVLDFGVAKAVGRLQTTREGEVKGKTAYMSPEQLRGKVVDRRADVYAVAVVLWEALTGHRLFIADTPSEVLMQVLSAEVEPPSRYAPAVPPELDALVMRGLARDRDERFATALEMAVALERTILPPTPREIGAWVFETAKDVLETRTRRVEHIERHGADVAVAVDPTAAQTAVSLIGAGASSPDLLGSQVSSISMTTPVTAPARPRNRAVGVAALSLLAGVALGAGGLASRGLHASPSTEEAATLAAPSASVLVSSAAPPASSIIHDNVKNNEEIENNVAPEPVKSASPKPKTKARPKVTAPSKSSSKPRCDPPYWIDADGIHVPKPECG